LRVFTRKFFDIFSLYLGYKYHKYAKNFLKNTDFRKNDHFFCNNLTKKNPKKFTDWQQKYKSPKPQHALEKSSKITLGFLTTYFEIQSNQYAITKI